MSVLIDQRILIPASTDVVWAVLADQQTTPRWRVDCQRISILTGRQFGVGMRRRCSAPKTKDKIEEITAWYEGVGYAYMLVESRRYRYWKAQIRLQAVPEGTIVQWTLEYAANGIFRSLRQFIGRERSKIEEQSAQSLRQLRRLVESSGQQLMDESLGKRQSQPLQPVQKIVSSSQQIVTIPVEEARASTKPRRPEGLDSAMNTPPPAPAIQDSQPVIPVRAAQEMAAFQPPPTPPVQSDAPTPPSGIQRVTSEAIEAAKVEAAKLESQPKIEIPPAADTKPKPPTKASEEKLPPGMPEILKATPPKGMPKVDVSRLRYADELEDNRQTPPAAENEAAVTTQAFRPGLPAPTAKYDTGEISIWDAFGIRAPSEQDAEALKEVVKRATGEHEAIRIETPVREGDTYTFSPLDTNFKIMRVRSQDHATGLRMKQAKISANLRGKKKAE